MTENGMRAFAKGFFDAIEQGGIAATKACVTPEAPIWRNNDERVVTPDDTAMLLAAMVARIGGRRHADRRVAIFPGGFVQQYVPGGGRVHYGGAVRLACAIVRRVEDGRITRLDEYFDSAHVAEFGRHANV